MERMILFPKYEYQCFHEGIKCFNEKNYQKAITLFNIAQKINFFKKTA